MRNVTIVVPVLITSCQVSEKWKSGPVASHVSTTSVATRKDKGRPAQREVALATRVNQDRDFVGRIVFVTSDTLSPPPARNGHVLLANAWWKPFDCITERRARHRRRVAIEKDPQRLLVLLADFAEHPAHRLV